jgi:hypothetical protein
VRDVFSLTVIVHGGCSPSKQFALI